MNINIIVLQRKNEKKNSVVLAEVIFHRMGFEPETFKFCIPKLFISYPHSTVILKEYFKNITSKSCNIAKIFIKLLERFLKYCRNLAMSVQNIINGILL